MAIVQDLWDSWGCKIIQVLQAVGDPQCHRLSPEARPLPTPPVQSDLAVINTTKTAINIRLRIDVDSVRFCNSAAVFSITAADCSRQPTEQI